MDSTESGPSAPAQSAPSTPSTPNAVSLTPPIPLQEKEMLFTDWGLSDTDNSQPVEATDDKGTGKTTNLRTAASRLPEGEREHRRKTKAFEAAFKKAAQQAAEKAAKEAREEAARKKAEEGSDDDSDDIEIIDLTGPRLPRQSQPPPPRPPRRTVSNIIESVRASATLRRTSSNPESQRQREQQNERQRGEKRRREEVEAATVKRKPGRPPKERTKDVKQDTKKKDKNAKDDITLVPEGQRIFAGLSFYYLPNEPFGARRLRINKARQHGVQWVKQLAEATHVIVDKQLRWGEVEVYVKKEMEQMSTGIEKSATEEPKWPFLVNETYPLDCIGFRHLLNPEQLRYRVSGWAQAQAKEKEQQEHQEKEEKERDKETDKTTGKNAVKQGDTSPPNRYLIKPDRKQQARLGTTGQQEHMIRQPRHG